MFHIAFFEVFKEEQLALKQHLPKNIKAFYSSKTIQSRRIKKLPAPFVSIRTQSIVPDSWKKDLKGILTRSSGYDHLRNFRREIPCGYLPNYCTRAVAEQAILMTLALMRRLKKQERQLERFNRDGITGAECLNKNLLVVGVGRIGREVVDLGHGLRMNVRGVDLVPRLKKLKYVSLAQGLNWADVLVCCLPFTKKTVKMLNAKALKSAKKGLILINISRGEITPLPDLQQLLNSGILGGLGLDVYENESQIAEGLRQQKKNSVLRLIRELKKQDNVVLTPHNAFNTAEAVERKAAESVAAIKMFLKKQAFPDPVPAK